MNRPLSIVLSVMIVSLLIAVAWAQPPTYSPQGGPAAERNMLHVGIIVSDVDDPEVELLWQELTNSPYSQRHFRYHRTREAGLTPEEQTERLRAGTPSIKRWILLGGIQENNQKSIDNKEDITIQLQAKLANGSQVITLDANKEVSVFDRIVRERDLDISSLWVLCDQSSASQKCLEALKAEWASQRKHPLSSHVVERTEDVTSIDLRDMMEVSNPPPSAILLLAENDGPRVVRALKDFPRHGPLIVIGRNAEYNAMNHSGQVDAWIRPDYTPIERFLAVGIPKDVVLPMVLSPITTWAAQIPPENGDSP